MVILTTFAFRLSNKTKSGLNKESFDPTARINTNLSMLEIFLRSDGWDFV